MDRLFSKYACPFPFIDGMIRTGRFESFVDDFMRQRAEEENEQRTWEFFLHRVFEGSFEDFKQQIADDEANRNMTANEIETAIKHSENILNNFIPERGE